MKILPVEAESFHVDGRTDDRTGRQTNVGKLKVAIRNFVNASKKNKIFDIVFWVNSCSDLVSILRHCSL